MPGDLEYDNAHVRLRAQWAPRVAAGVVKCWRCDELIASGATWDLGHDDEDRAFYRGPEHRKCNRATSTRKAFEQGYDHSRDW
jgi:hypothetical protein